jgi:cytoskeletal protein CcmA (bactofilin family)
LELNARNSNVTLQGNYYGYNYNNSGSAVYNTYETNEKTNIGGKYTASAGTSAAAHTTSSAIIVNGNNSTLDLTGLNTLMVAGVAYVDIKDSSKSYAELSAGSAQEYRTGESIALRYNQFMYLAPDEILDGVSNPQLNGTTDASAVCPSNGNEKLSKWFGSSYLDTAADSPVIPVVYIDNGQSYTYYYLRLKEGQEENYVKSFMEVTDAGEEGNLFDKQKWELKQAMLKRAESSSIASHITVQTDGTAGNTNIYTAGLLTDTKESSRTIQDNSITLSDMAVRSTNLQKHYLQMYVNLEPNSVQEIEPAKLSDAGYPLKNFLKLDNFNGVVNVNIADRAVENVKDASVWIMKASSADVNLSGNKKRGIILCDGDLTISGNGGSFEGLIIATGKITVTGNVTIKANSGVVQAVLEAEQRSVTQIAKSEADSVKLNEYASYYFINTVLADLISLDEGSLIDMDNRVTGTDYTDYIYYKNWQKGETG